MAAARATIRFAMSTPPSRGDGSYSPLFNRALKRWEQDTPPSSPTQQRTNLRRKPSHASYRSAHAPHDSSSAQVAESPQRSPLQRFFSILRKPRNDASAPSSPTMQKGLPDLPYVDVVDPYYAGSQFELGPPPSSRRSQARRAATDPELFQSSHADMDQPYSDHVYATSPSASRRTSFSGADGSLNGYRFASKPASHLSGRSEYPRSVASSVAGLPAPTPSIASMPDSPYLYRPAVERIASVASSAPSSACSKIRRRGADENGLPATPWPSEPIQRIDFGNPVEGLEKDVFASFAKWQTEALPELPATRYAENPARRNGYHRRKSSHSSGRSAASTGLPNSFLTFDEYDR